MAHLVTLTAPTRPALPRRCADPGASRRCASQGRHNRPGTAPTSRVIIAYRDPGERPRPIGGAGSDPLRVRCRPPRPTALIEASEQSPAQRRPSQTSHTAGWQARNGWPRRGSARDLGTDPHQQQSSGGGRRGPSHDPLARRAIWRRRRGGPAAGVSLRWPTPSPPRNWSAQARRVRRWLHPTRPPRTDGTAGCDKVTKIISKTWRYRSTSWTTRARRSHESRSSSLRSRTSTTTDSRFLQLIRTPRPGLSTILNAL